MIRLRALGPLSLVSADGDEVTSVLAQPKRTLLLCCLAALPPNSFLRRDSLLALFWPESDQEHARGSLNRSLHFLRRSLGHEVIVSRGAEEVGLDARRFWSDVAAFRETLSAGEDEAALALYRGDFLPGFHAGGSVELDRWLEGERGQLQRTAREAADRLAEGALSAGDPAAATAWARRALALEPHHERTLRLLLQALDSAGERAGALTEYQVFRRRLICDLGVEPAPEPTALVERLRG